MGLEPTPSGLRIRYAAVYTTALCVLFGFRFLASRFDFAHLQVRPEGFEPSLAGLKVRCATVTPQPQINLRSRAFQSLSLMVHVCSPVVAPRIELGATPLSGAFEQPAPDYRCFCDSDSCLCSSSGPRGARTLVFRASTERSTV